MEVVSDLNGVLADSESVPEFDGVVSRARDYLSVVGREGYTHDILCVSHKPPSGGATGEREREREYVCVLKTKPKCANM